MDRKQLTIENAINKELLAFREECARKNYPLRELCLAPYPGWSGTYNLEVYADWIETMSCGEALDILTDVMFETIRQEHRAMIFIIKILDKTDVVHCVEESNFALAEVAF
jgi:hypothetical protein